MHSDFYLFALAVLKCALVTGIGPGILVLLVLWKLVRVGPEYDDSCLGKCSKEQTNRRPALSFTRKAA